MILDDSRDLWWNADYVDLVAARLGLGSIPSLVDVGSGLGHWSRLWQPRLAPGAWVVGIDRDARHVRGANEWFARTRPAADARFLVGDALALPIADGVCAAATCQTLLMHLAEPERAFAELVRIVRPGGLVFCAEPQNLFSLLRWNDAMHERPPDEIAAMLELWLRVQRGKRALGLGDATFGERLPGLFARAGLEDIRVWQSDRAFAIHPPYRHEDLMTFATDGRARKRGVAAWDEADLRAKHRAGGGDDAIFDATFARLRRWADTDEKDVAKNRYAATHGGTLFLVAGRKPRETT